MRRERRTTSNLGIILLVGASKVVVLDLSLLVIRFREFPFCLRRLFFKRSILLFLLYFSALVVYFASFVYRISLSFNVSHHAASL